MADIDFETRGASPKGLTGFKVTLYAGGDGGRPVGVTTGKDGSLFVVDDGSKSAWDVECTGR